MMIRSKSTLYGPRENESHAVIAFIAKALIKQDPYEIWGSGQQDRNFTYVSDVVEGIKLAAEHLTDCRVVNIGNNEFIKIVNAVNTVCNIMNHQPKKFIFDIQVSQRVYILMPHPQ
jgi:UDP-glucose 4-epimerase